MIDMSSKSQIYKAMEKKMFIGVLTAVLLSISSLSAQGHGRGRRQHHHQGQGHNHYQQHHHHYQPSSQYYNPYNGQYGNTGCSQVVYVQPQQVVVVAPQPAQVVVVPAPRQRRPNVVIFNVPIIF